MGFGLRGAVAVVLEPARRRRSRCRLSLESTRPASVRMPNSRPLSAIRMSGRSCPAQSARPSAIGARPAQRPRPIQSTTTIPPRAMSPSAAGGPEGTPTTAPPSPATNSATRDDVAHAEADDLERQPVEPERRGEDRDHRRRHHHHAHRRDREQVRDEPVLRQRVEVEGRERRRRGARDQRGHRDPEHRLGEAPARRGLGHAATTAGCAAPRRPRPAPRSRRRTSGSRPGSGSRARARAR